MSTLRIIFCVYLKFNFKRRPPKLNEKLHLNVISKRPIAGFLLTIVARGKIVSNAYFKMLSNPRNRTLKMTVEFNLIPEATFYVYSFKGEEMLMDLKTITFENDFGNSVCLRMMFFKICILYDLKCFSYVSRFK